VRPLPQRVEAVWAAVHAGSHRGRAARRARLDPAVDVSISLFIDPRKSDQLVRGTAELPHGTGRVREVAVFAEGDEAEAARAAGATVVGGEALVNQIAETKSLAADVVVSTRAMQPRLSKVARILGPRCAGCSHSVDVTSFCHARDHTSMTACAHCLVGHSSAQPDRSRSV
jgi:ribosomal protein L1